jgi:hypothetical protein
MGNKKCHSGSMSKSFLKWPIVNTHFRFNCYWGRVWHFGWWSVPSPWPKKWFQTTVLKWRWIIHKESVPQGRTTCAHFYLKVRDKLLQRILWSDQTFKKTRTSSCCITMHQHTSYSLCEFFSTKLGSWYQYTPSSTIHQIWHSDSF